MEFTKLHIPLLTSSVLDTLYQFQQERYLCDVLIFTADGYVPAHRVVLVAASKYFRDIESCRNIHTTPEANFYLTKEKSEDMQKIVQLIYTGYLNVSFENVKRIYSLCQTLHLDDVIKELEIFMSQNNIDIGHGNINSVGQREDNSLSLKQLETEVINHLERTRSTNASLISTSVVADEGTTKIEKFDDTEEDDHVEDENKSNEEKISKKSKFKKQVKVKNTEKEIAESEVVVEKLINCALCKEKFPDKKQLLEHRRLKHPNKRKPMHTKRYIPDSNANDTLSDNEDHENSAENEISTSSSVEKEDEYVLSTRQGTKRHSMYDLRLSKLRKASKMFICRLCKDEFESNELLQEHRKLIHPGGKRENLTCNLCDKVLSTWLNLIEHKYKKHDIAYDMEKYKVLMCDMPNCDFSTIVEYKLKTHFSDVHGEIGSYVCDVCSKGCKSAPQLKYHMKTMHPDGRSQSLHKCDDCGKTFRHSCNLKKHIDSIHLKVSDKKYLCHLCTYKCMSKTDLNNHLLKIHDIPLPKSCKVYRCESCDYFTLTRSCYERHKQLHEENGLQKTYMCSTCGKGFYNIQNVKAHEKRHKSVIMVCPFDGCLYSTKFKHTMKNHIEGMHTHKNYRPYQCHQCEYSCKLKGNLDKHLRGKHGIEVMTIPKLRQKAIETGKGFTDIVFPPRNCDELPAKLADKHQLQTTQKSQDINLSQLLEMVKNASKEQNLTEDTLREKRRSKNGDSMDVNITIPQVSQKDGEHIFRSPETSSSQDHQYPTPSSSVVMETEGPSYIHEQETALSNLNPVPISIGTGKQSNVKGQTYSSSHDLPVSYAEQNMMYLNEQSDSGFSSKHGPSHFPQTHSAESYAAMLSSFLNSKNASQPSPHQTLPSLLPLNMQNYQSSGQHHPTILNHLLTQMEGGGYSTLGRPTSVPVEESISYPSQLRPHSAHPVENLSYRNLTYESQDNFEPALSTSDESYHHESGYPRSVQHQSPTNQRHSYNGSKETTYNPDLNSSQGQSNRKRSGNNSSAEKSLHTSIDSASGNPEEYQDIAQLAYNQS